MSTTLMCAPSLVAVGESGSVRSLLNHSDDDEYEVQQQTPTVVSTTDEGNSAEEVVTSDASFPPSTSLSASSSSDATRTEDGYITPPLREYPKEYAKYQIHQMELDKLPAPSPTPGTKRKCLHLEHSLNDHDDRAVALASKRKANSDYLRKGQWTATEERLARLLIEAFEEGYLPIYTGIRLRGYLAVQLQCDPMRVSKKLCAGSVDGKKIPKNYGQRKFKLRRKGIWDRDEAGRILATLERLTKEMWKETGIDQPEHITLSSTRNADDELPPTDVAQVEPQTSPVKKLSPSVNKSKKPKDVVFPIIYLNLSKKLKQTTGNGASQSFSSEVDEPVTGTPITSEADEEELDYTRRHHDYTIEPEGKLTENSSHNDNNQGSTASVASSSSSSLHFNIRSAVPKVDGESLQAAYELLNLCRPAPP